MRAATVTMPMFCTSTMRMPVRMTGSARMSSMPVRICQLVMPMPRAASTAARGTRFSPATVLAAIGSSEYRNRATAAGAAPMPRIPSAAASGTAAASAASGTIRMPNSAIAGIVWITLSVPSTPERIPGRGHRERYGGDPQQRCAEPYAGVGYPEGCDRRADQDRLAAERSPRRQRVQQPAWIAGHDAVGLQDHERQEHGGHGPGAR